MPFVKVNVKQEVDKRLAQDSELQKAYQRACEEYEVKKQLVEQRKKNNISPKR